MPACYFVHIADTHMYFDKNRFRCRAPGSRPVGQPNIIYFVRTATPYPLLDFSWNDGLRDFSPGERKCGAEWVKDAVYESGQPGGVLASAGKNPRNLVD